MGRIARGALGAFGGLAAASCIILLNEYGAFVGGVVPAAICTQTLRAHDIWVFGAQISESFQRTFVFSILFATLLAAAVRSRIYANEVDEFLRQEIKWEPRGRAPLIQNLLPSLWKRFLNWWVETKGPLVALARVGVFGFLAPIAAFFALAFLFGWLFPGVSLGAKSADGAKQCTTHAADLLNFIWSHFWRGAALNLPDVFGWSTSNDLIQGERDPATVLFISSLRLYLSWAGSISLAQTLYHVFKRQLVSLYKVLSIPIGKIWRRWRAGKSIAAATDPTDSAAVTSLLPA